jgi:MYXO-CTERM domain-containing protein
MWAVRHRILTGIFLAAAAFLSTPANAATGWSWANPSPQGNYLNASATGGGISVAAGNGGTVYVDAGAGWLPQTSGTTNNLDAVIFGAGLFVAVGSSNTIITSNDGVNWTSASVTGTTQNLNSVAYGNGVFVAAGSNGIVFTSTDGGATWGPTGNFGQTVTVTSVVFGCGEFVALAHDSTNSTSAIFYSDDGTVWNSANVPTLPADAPIDAAFNGTLFVAMGLNADGNSGGSILTSDDGINWTTQTPLLPATSSPISITTNGSAFVIMLESAASDTGVTTPVSFETSTDGVNWSTVGANDLPASWSQNIPRQISYTGSAYLVVGAGAYISSSTDLVTWTSLSPESSLTFDRLRGVQWLVDRFFAVGDDDTILTSADGVTWTKQNVAASIHSNLRDIAYNGKLYVIVGSNNVVLTSSDGSNWSAAQIKPAAPTGTVFTGLAWNGSLFVTVGTAGVIYSSPDGTTWTPQVSGTADNLWGVVWVGNYFVAVTDSTQDSDPIIISSDGIHWKPTTFYVSDPVALYGIHWDGARMIVSGSATPAQGVHEGFVATSTDCFCWDTYYGNVDDVFSDVAFNGNQYIAVGGSSLYTSTDAKNWTTPEPAIQGTRLQKLAAHNGQLVATGYAGALVHSTTLVATANDGSISTKVDTSMSNALKAWGSGLTFAVAQPAHGKVTLADTSTGAFTYTPTPGYSGSDQFTFTASNSAGISNTATESITVNDVPAVAHDGSSTIVSGKTLYAGLTASASYGEQKFIYQLVSNPSHGSVVLANPWDGSFSYTPAAGFTGDDSFEFNVIDDAGTLSNTATQRIAVTAEPTSPSGTSNTPPPSGTNNSSTNSAGTNTGNGGGADGMLALLLLALPALLRRRR